MIRFTQEIIQWSRIADLYNGKVLNGLRHGKGILTYKSGDIYEGTWRKGKIHGKGLFKFARGKAQEVVYRSIKYSLGETYEGLVKDNIKNEKHGWGRLAYANGDCYEGGWKDNIKHGHGCITSPDGKVEEVVAKKISHNNGNKVYSSCTSAGKKEVTKNVEEITNAHGDEEENQIKKTGPRFGGDEKDENMDWQGCSNIPSGQADERIAKKINNTTVTHKEDVDMTDNDQAAENLIFSRKEILYPNGDKYEGHVRDGCVRHGWGKQIYCSQRNVNIKINFLSLQTVVKGSC